MGKIMIVFGGKSISSSLKEMLLATRFFICRLELWCGGFFFISLAHFYIIWMNQMKVLIFELDTERKKVRKKSNKWQLVKRWFEGNNKKNASQTLFTSFRIVVLFLALCEESCSSAWIKENNKHFEWIGRDCITTMLLREKNFAQIHFKCPTGTQPGSPLKTIGSKKINEYSTMSWEWIERINLAQITEKTPKVMTTTTTTTTEKCIPPTDFNQNIACDGSIWMSKSPARRHARVTFKHVGVGFFFSFFILFSRSIVFFSYTKIYTQFFLEISLFSFFLLRWYVAHGQTENKPVKWRINIINRQTRYDKNK